jgi:GT2 family glycosyltransferase
VQPGREATGDYLLFLNNDTEVLAPGWLGHLLRLAGHPRVGVAGATLLYPDGTVQHAGAWPRRDGRWIHAYRGERVGAAWPAEAPGDARLVPAVTGACLLLRRELFDALGGFDERLAVAGNDVDLCRRVRERGLEVAVSRHARLLHYEGLSRGHSLEDDRAIVHL